MDLKQNWPKLAVGGIVLAGLGYYVYKQNALAQKEEPMVVIEKQKTIVDIEEEKANVNGDVWPKPRKIVHADHSIIK